MMSGQIWSYLTSMISQIASDQIGYWWYQIRSDLIWYQSYRSDQVKSDIDDIRSDLIRSDTNDIRLDQIGSDIINIRSDLISMWYWIQLDQIWCRQYAIGSGSIWYNIDDIGSESDRVRYRWYQIRSDDLISLISEPVRADLILVISDPTRSDPTLPPIRPPDNLIADHSHYAPYDQPTT